MWCFGARPRLRFSVGAGERPLTEPSFCRRGATSSSELMARSFSSECIISCSILDFWPEDLDGPGFTAGDAPPTRGRASMSMVCRCGAGGGTGAVTCFLDTFSNSGMPSTRIDTGTTSSGLSQSSNNELNFFLSAAETGREVDFCDGVFFGGMSAGTLYSLILDETVEAILPRDLDWPIDDLQSDDFLVGLRRFLDGGDVTLSSRRVALLRLRSSIRKPVLNSSSSMNIQSFERKDLDEVVEMTAGNDSSTSMGAASISLHSLLLRCLLFFLDFFFAFFGFFSCTTCSDKSSSDESTIVGMSSTSSRIRSSRSRTGLMGSSLIWMRRSSRSSSSGS
uniref:(northern house mosquito) hypothetical protein n=1 Tax=Culex pipiens TaxID=7175 RepID=A0A8D8FFB1_CULPI